MTERKRQLRNDESEEAPPSALWTEKETAKYMGFSTRTLQGWRSLGGGPKYVRVSSRCIRYRPDDVEAWIRDRLRLSTADDGLEA